MSEVINAVTMKETTFFFREKKKGGEVIEKKREPFKVNIPQYTGQEIINLIFDESMPEQRREQVINYIADLANAEIYASAQGQINAKLENIDDPKAREAYTLSATDIDTTKLDLVSLALVPPAQRGAAKLFSDEFTLETCTAFSAWVSANLKRPNGEPVAPEVAAKTAEEIFVNKFKGTKTDKQTLTLFQTRLTLWFAAIDQADQARFQGITEWALGKITAYLNPEAKSVLGKFE